MSMIVRLDIDGSPEDRYHRRGCSSDYFSYITYKILSICDIKRIDYSLRKGYHIVAECPDKYKADMIALAFDDPGRLYRDQKRPPVERGVLFNKIKIFVKGKRVI